MIHMLKHLFMTGKDALKHPRRFKKQRGAVLVVVIVTMTIAAGLGAAMLSMTSTTTTEDTTANQGQKGMYLAESGLRYAAGEYRRAGTVEQQDAMLRVLHDNTYQLGGGNEFNLDIRPYYFEAVEVTGGALKMRPFGGIPHCFDGGAADGVAGYLKSGTTKYDYTYSGTTVAAEGDETFLYFNSISDSGSIVAGDIVFPVCRVNGDATVSKNGDISIQSGTGIEIFPPENCRFRINNVGTVYRYKKLNLADNLLETITQVDNPGAAFTLTLTDGNYIVPERFIKLTSSGSVGTAGAETTRDVAFDLAVEQVTGTLALYGIFGNEKVLVKNSGQITSYDSTNFSGYPPASTAQASVCSNEKVQLENSAYIDGNVYLGDDGNDPPAEAALTLKNSASISGESIDVDRVTSDPFAIGACSGAFAGYFDAAESINDNLNADLAKPIIADNKISLSCSGGSGSGGSGSGGSGHSSIWDWLVGTAWAKKSGGSGGSGSGGSGGSGSGGSGSGGSGSGSGGCGHSGSGGCDCNMTLYGKTGGSSFYVTEITLSNEATLTIDTTGGPVNIYLEGNLETANDTKIKVLGNSKATIYLSGKLTAKNDSEINKTERNPPNLTIYSCSTENMVFENDTVFAGAVFAPNATITVKNDAKIYGALWGNKIQIENDGKVYFDTSLTNAFSAGSGYTLKP